jgi:hypothetical protein
VLGLALRTSDAHLQLALAAIPGAGVLIDDFTTRRRGVDARFDAQEAALRAAFRDARARLSAA